MISSISNAATSPSKRVLIEKLFKAGFLQVSMLSSAQQGDWLALAISAQAQMPEAEKKQLEVFVFVQVHLFAEIAASWSRACFLTR